MDNIKLEESQIHYKEEPPYKETPTCWKTKPTRTVRFNKDKPQVLHLGWNYLIQQ